MQPGPNTNPAPASVNGEVASLDRPDAGTIEHIFCWESGGHGVDYPQFNPARNRGEKAFPDIPADWTPNPPVMQPHYGAPPAGIGIAQDDPATFPEQQWDWTHNVARGVRVYQDGLAAAQKLRHDEQNRLTRERKAALDLVNATRAAHHPKLAPVSVPLLVVPPEPAPYSKIDGVTADAITRYNTGPRQSLFYVNYYYLASSDNLQVLTRGTGQWVTQDGHWRKYAQWQAHGGIHTARLWRVNASWNPDYVDQVESCTPPR